MKALERRLNLRWHLKGEHDFDGQIKKVVREVLDWSKTCVKAVFVILIILIISDVLALHLFGDPEISFEKENSRKDIKTKIH